MGMLIEGRWSDVDPIQETGKDGDFRRVESVYREFITADGSSGFRAERGRYHLYVAHGAPAVDEALLAEITPCFRDDGVRTDTVVLACTHYPLLIARLRQLSPWPVNFIDPAPAIARRVVDLLGAAPSPDAPPATGAVRAVFTSGRAPAVLARFGIPANQPATTAAD